MVNRKRYAYVIAGQGGHNQMVIFPDRTYGVGRTYEVKSFGNSGGQFFDGEVYNNRKAAQKRFDEKEAAVMAYFKTYGTANE